MAESDRARRQQNEEEKRIAAEAGAALVQSGMTVGLGTGTTVAYLLPALAARHLDIVCVSTSPATEFEARRLGLTVQSFEGIANLDLAIDGADQVDDSGWLVKGGGGAHTREKVVAAAATTFVVIVSSNKLVDRVRGPVPLELLTFGLDSTLARLAPSGPVVLRKGTPASPDGGHIADWHGEIDDPARVAAYLAAEPGVVEHGLFPPAMVADVIVGRVDGVEHRPVSRG
jgi:ribose 5-phosphate isomerase A